HSMSDKKRRLSRPQLWFLLALLVLIATGCYGTRMGESWPALTTVEVYDEAAIAVSYNNKVSLLQPRNGALVRLLNADGEIRFDDADNPRNWEVDGGQYEGAQFFSNPIVLDDGDTFLLPSITERLLEVDTFTAEPNNATGIPVLGKVISNVILDGETLYVPIKSGIIQALDRSSGDTKWEFSVNEGIWSDMILEDGVLYAGSMDHFLYALDAETGEMLWNAPADLEGAITAPPLLHNGMLYAGSFSHKMYQITLDGEIVASYKGNNWIWSTPVIDSGVLYYTDLSGYVYALDADTLEELWAIKAAERGIRAAPLLTEDYVVVGSRDSQMHWLDRETGAVLFERQIEGGGEILSDILLLEADETLNIPEPLVIIGTSATSHLVVAFPLDFDSGYQGWVYSR
ncbi:MAG: PQQ-binding-like beta-propeller repeat protein, partial [Aggregatilineales bacterium]